MDPGQVLRQQLLALLRSENAHMDFEEAVADFPIERMNERPSNVPYSPWAILEHLRITQWDILEFVRNPAHISPNWPEGYWPRSDQRADETTWEKTVQAFRADLKALQDMAVDPNIHLMAPIPHAPDYTVLRELLLAADHNAYHVGEFAILRQVMGTWPEGRRS